MDRDLRETKVAARTDAAVSGMRDELEDMITVLSLLAVIHSTPACADVTLGPDAQVGSKTHIGQGCVHGSPMGPLHLSSTLDLGINRRRLVDMFHA